LDVRPFHSRTTQDPFPKEAAERRRTTDIQYTDIG
jgi:hypothetical protein